MLTRPRRRTGEQCVSVSLSELLELSTRSKQRSLSSLRVRNPQTGQHVSPRLGRGMEFAESRRYQAGDESRTIDWRVTARTGKAHTKLFTEEKARQVLLCADLRSSMFFATKGVFKSVQTALLMGQVAWKAAQSGHRLGGIILDDRNHFECRPAFGKRGVLPFLQRLAESVKFQSKETEKTSSHTMDQAMDNLKRVASPGSLIFMMSDFRHFSSHSRDVLIQLAKHSHLSLCFVYDALERALPKNGYYPVTQGEIELQLNTFDKKKMEKYQQQFIARREWVASLGHYRSIHFMECSTEDDCFEMLRNCF